MNATFLGFVGPIQIILIALVIALIFIFPIYFLIYYKRNISERAIPAWAKALLFIPSLTWAGIIIGLYIWFRKKQYNNKKQYKFSRNSRFFGTIITLVSIICTIAYYTNKNNPFQ